MSYKHVVLLVLRGEVLSINQTTKLLDVQIVYLKLPPRKLNWQAASSFFFMAIKHKEKYLTGFNKPFQH